MMASTFRSMRVGRPTGLAGWLAGRMSGYKYMIPIQWRISHINTMIHIKMIGDNTYYTNTCGYNTY